MSEDASPPQLRLRPRKRDDESTVSPPAMPEGQPPAGPAASSEAGSLRFRLKPKLISEPVADASETAHDPLPDGEINAAESPEDSSELPAEVPRLRLKPLVPGEKTSAFSEAASSLREIGISPPPIPAFPVMQPPLSNDDGGARPPVFGAIPPLPPPLAAVPPPPLLLSQIPPLNSPQPVSAPSPYKNKVKFKRPKTAVLISAAAGLLVVMVVAGYFFFSSEEAPVPVVVAPRPIVRPTPVEPPAAPAAAVNPIPAVDPVAEKPAVAAIEPAQPQQIQTPPKSPAKPHREPVIPLPTPEFRLWVESARISGVLSGENPRAIINGRMVRPGDMVDATQGIVFDKLDLERKQIVFRSEFGAFVNKPY